MLGTIHQKIGALAFSSYNLIPRLRRLVVGCEKQAYIHILHETLEEYKTYFFKHFLRSSSVTVVVLERSLTLKIVRRV